MVCEVLGGGDTPTRRPHHPLVQLNNVVDLHSLRERDCGQRCSFAMDIAVEIPLRSSPHAVTVR